MSTNILRLAVWSGPRNISTALMRSWENRADTCVIDEPFYAHYLHQTGLEHPDRDAVLASQPIRWEDVRDKLTGSIPKQYSIFYQKHMTHHFLPNMHSDWLKELTNVFILRDPEAMLTSLAKILPLPTLRDTGLPQQLELFQKIETATGKKPLVIDATDILRQPEQALRTWCKHLAIPFDIAMLKWPSGPRDTDGIWAKHWYKSVTQSTHFKPYCSTGARLPNNLRETLSTCIPYHQALARYKLSISE